VPRAVVTGGAGFVGSHLCDRLLAEGWEVVCLDSLITGTESNLERAGSHPGFRFERHDVTTGLPVDGDVDAILHLASPASPVDYLEHPLETLEVGAVGTLRALELAEERSAELLLASTSEVYGDPTVNPQPETYWGNVNPIGPRAVYDEAKRYAEAATMAHHRARGARV
jgi:dTDP-glucose 4,6-dehydratase